MVRNDDFFVRKWVEYYGSRLGKDNIYIYFDGVDQQVPACCDGANVQCVPHIKGNVRKGDRKRAEFLSMRAIELFDEYDLVIGTDVDEFLIVDPALGVSLPEFLSSLDCNRGVSFSGLGVDVGQDTIHEGVLNPERPMLSQRHAAKLSTRYSKASVLHSPAPWGSGFHRVKGKNFHIVKDLYLFHFGCVDLERLKERMNRPDLLKSGWGKHLEKRAGTISLVSSRKARNFKFWTRFARHIQNAVRPPYAWNKPAMFEARIVVEIPERFSDIV